MNTRRLVITVGSVIAALTWGFNTPRLLDMLRFGEISALTFLVLFAAFIALLVGALRVQFGKNGRLSFVVHLVSLAAAGLQLGLALPVLLSLSAVVAVVALAWPASAQQATEGDVRA